jgi:hypothetical protein
MPEVTVCCSPNGIADGEHKVPDLYLVGIPQLHLHQALCILDLQYGDIGAGIGADHLGLQAAVVIEVDLDQLGALDHMVIGQDVALGGIDDDPGAGALHLAPPLLGLLLVGKAEKPAEEGVFHQRIGGRVDGALGGDADHGRLHLFDQWCERGHFLVANACRQLCAGRTGDKGQQQRSPTEKSCHAYKTFGR